MPRPYDLVLLDIDMPRHLGRRGSCASCRRIRRVPISKSVLSGRASGDEMAQMLATGADDYLTKPFSLVQLLARIKAALHLKSAQDRSDMLTHLLLTMNHELDQTLHSPLTATWSMPATPWCWPWRSWWPTATPRAARRLMPLQHYSRLLATEAAKSPALAGQLDANFIELLECCAPLHDIGKVGLPDDILLKPGKLTTDERVIMQTHTTIGAAVLQKVARKHPFAATFMQMAVDIARHHHERYDGAGYPDRLAGSAIPLSARIVAFGDVYDALRSRARLQASPVASGIHGHHDRRRQPWPIRPALVPCVREHCRSV